MPFVSSEYHGTSSDGINWICSEEFEFTAIGKYFRIIIGATTDGPSIPENLKPLIPIDVQHKMWLPAVCHDACYRFQIETLIDGNYIKEGLAKNECDNVFYELMIDNGIPEPYAKMAYEAVRIFGWKAFHEDRDENLES